MFSHVYYHFHYVAEVGRAIELNFLDPVLIGFDHSFYTITLWIKDVAI